MALTEATALTKAMTTAPMQGSTLAEVEPTELEPMEAELTEVALTEAEPAADGRKAD